MRRACQAEGLCVGAQVPAMQAITCRCSQQQGTPVLKRHHGASIPMGLLQTYTQALC